MLKRDIYIFSGVGLLTLVLAVGVWLGSALPTGSWGLSFRQEGAPPIGTAGADQLGRYDAAYLGDTSEKVLYLTFDAGYENGCTEKILDTLKKHNAKAAFFSVPQPWPHNPVAPPWITIFDGSCMGCGSDTFRWDNCPLFW